MTCGIDKNKKITKGKNIFKIKRLYHPLTIKHWKTTFLSEGLNRNFIKSQIPPRREIWFKSPGFHPEENLGWKNTMAD